jgi:hypothetical protein
MLCCAAAYSGQITGLALPADTPATLQHNPSWDLFSDNVNNDDDPDAAPFWNFLTYSISFDQAVPVDLQFTVSNTGGVSEYGVTANLKNLSNMNWDGVRLTLGQGTGDQFVAFAEGDVDFDWPDQNSNRTSHRFASRDLGRFTYHLHSGLVEAYQGDTVAYDIMDFAIDIPDGLSGGTFTLRHEPLPEPGTIAMMCALGACAIRVRRRPGQ